MSTTIDNHIINSDDAILLEELKKKPSLKLTLIINWNHYSIIDFLVCKNKPNSLEYLISQYKFKYIDTRQSPVGDFEIGFNIMNKCFSDGYKKWNFLIEWLITQDNENQDYLSIVITNLNEMGKFDKKMFFHLCPKSHKKLSARFKKIRSLMTFLVNSTKVLPHMFEEDELTSSNPIDFVQFCSKNDLDLGLELGKQIDVDRLTRLAEKFNSLKTDSIAMREEIDGYDWDEFVKTNGLNDGEDESKQINFNELVEKSFSKFCKKVNPAYPNPIELEYGMRSDISCDSSSGYDGENGRMDCWELETWSRTDSQYYCLNESMGKSWDLNVLELMDLFVLAGCWAHMGFEVYVVDFSVWRKGYDYSVSSLGDVIEHIATCNDIPKYQYVRLYVKKY